MARGLGRHALSSWSAVAAASAATASAAAISGTSTTAAARATVAAATASITTTTTFAWAAIVRGTAAFVGLAFTFAAAAGLAGRAIDGADEDRAVVLDVDLSAGLFLNLLDVLAPRADELADLFRIDLDGEQARGPLADFRARLGQHLGHLVENDQARFAGPL